MIICFIQRSRDVYLFFYSDFYSSPIFKRHVFSLETDHLFPEKLKTIRNVDSYLNIVMTSLRGFNKN